MSAPTLPTPTLRILVEGYTDYRVLGLLLGNLGMKHVGSVPQDMLRPTGQATTLKQRTIFEGTGKRVDVIVMKGKDEFAGLIQALALTDGGPRSRFLVMRDADQAALKAWQELKSQFEPVVALRERPNSAWQSVALTPILNLELAIWLSMDSVSQTGSIDTLLREALRLNQPELVDDAVSLESKHAVHRTNSTTASDSAANLQDKAVIGIAHAVLDPRRQYESAFRDSPVWKHAILNPEGPFAPLLEFLRTTLQPDA